MEFNQVNNNVNNNAGNVINSSKPEDGKWKQFCKRFLACYEGTDDVFDLYAAVKKALEDGSNG